MFNVLPSCEFLFDLKLVELELYDHMKVNDDPFQNVRTLKKPLISDPIMTPGSR
jgi:hypothetical protein